MTSKSGSPKLILGDNFVSRWIFITILSTVGGSIIGLLISQPLVCMRTIHTDIIGVILLGSTIGAAIGLGQSYQMKDLMQVPHWWIVANIFGWMIAILLFEFYAPIARCFISTNAPIYESPLADIIHRQLSVIAEQIGFVKEGTMRKAYDQDEDVHIYGFLNDEFKTHNWYRS